MVSIRSDVVAVLEGGALAVGLEGMTEDVDALSGPNCLLLPQAFIVAAVAFVEIADGNDAHGRE